MRYPNNSHTAPKVTSSYGWRTHPVTQKRGTFHAGTDYIGFATVSSVAWGKVIVVGTPAGWGGGGTQVWIEHAGFVARYLHLASTSVRVGQTVVEGQALGRMGMTGTATGVHLHLEIVVGGQQVDPVQFLKSRVGGAPKNIGVLVEDGVPGPLTYKALQKAVGVKADGILGNASWRAIQKRVGAAVDGRPGPQTWRAVQKYVGAGVDGMPGNQTWKAIQRQLNNGRF